LNHNLFSTIGIGTVIVTLWVIKLLAVPPHEMCSFISILSILVVVDW